MKYIFSLLLAFCLFTVTANAQVDDSPTYAGTVTGMTVGEDTTVFEVDRDGDGAADQTFEADNDLEGTEDIEVGMPVEYKLNRKRRHGGDEPRKVRKWEKIGSSAPGSE